MLISIFDLFSIGIGPSSSHTIGPMKAAKKFIEDLHDQQKLILVDNIKIELFGSLAFTGKGHGTDQAILLGLEGNDPETISPEYMKPRFTQIKDTKQLHLLNQHIISFDVLNDLIFNFKDLLPLHTNGMRFNAYHQAQLIQSEIFYSIGGGFIIQENEKKESVFVDICFPFDTTFELLKHCETQHMPIQSIMLANETCLRSKDEVKSRLMHISHIMLECIQKGCESEGILPGGLNIPRRAPDLYKKLKQKGMPSSYEHTDSLSWLNLYAIAVNEENAAGSRVVTAPTNGAAGVVPAVLYYYLHFYPQAKSEDAIDFLLVAGAIAILCKKGASISGAEVGCQGEVGSACAMAAAALTAVLGGSIEQVENAAEIAMEHHLGMTCDPIKGLVQIPCIERNAMAAIKAVNAARLALLGNGKHFVSLDKAILTMKQTGQDMLSIYKETSLGGLAVNLPEC